MLDPISWCAIGAATLVTGVVTYFVTRHVSSTDDEAVKQQINSQILIAKEQDNSHEYSQTIIIIIIAIVLTLICVYWRIKCVFKAMQRNIRYQTAIPMHIIPQNQPNQPDQNAQIL